jgi:hypothetical protein
MNKSRQDGLSLLAEAIQNFARPRISFDIVPQSVIPNLLDVVIRNAGYTPAYHVTFKFKDDIYYYEKCSLANLPIFKKELPILEQGQEIRFFYGDLPSILGRGGALGKKQTKVTVQYTDVNDNPGAKYNDTYEVDIERYKEILSIDRHDINSLVKEISSLRRGFEKIIGSGLLVKTLSELEKEKREYLKRYSSTSKNA